MPAYGTMHMRVVGDHSLFYRCNIVLFSLCQVRRHMQYVVVRTRIDI